MIYFHYQLLILANITFFYEFSDAEVIKIELVLKSLRYVILETIEFVNFTIF